MELCKNENDYMKYYKKHNITYTSLCFDNKIEPITCFKNIHKTSEIEHNGDLICKIAFECIHDINLETNPLKVNVEIGSLKIVYNINKKILLDSGLFEYSNDNYNNLPTLVLQYNRIIVTLFGCPDEYYLITHNICLSVNLRRILAWYGCICKDFSFIAINGVAHLSLQVDYENNTFRYIDYRNKIYNYSYVKVCKIMGSTLISHGSYLDKLVLEEIKRSLIILDEQEQIENI